MNSSVRLAALFGCALLFSACDSTDPTTDTPTPDENQGASADAQWTHALAFGPDSHPFGRSMTTWSEAWWRWQVSIPTERNPSLDPTGANCAEGQRGRVWKLGVLFGTGEVTRHCEIPGDKAFLINLSGILNDYPCPDPNFKPAPGQTLEEFLTEGARTAVDMVNGLTLSVDGHSVGGLFNRRYTSPLYHFVGDPSLATSIDGCITGSRQAAVSDGFYIMLKPLSRGRHTVAFKGSDTKGVHTSVTYILTVRRSRDDH